ncbi:MAG: hypothetical protein AAF696_15800 [Bacteroidota bacterium]
METTLFEILVSLGEMSQMIQDRNPGKEKQISGYVNDFIENELPKYSTTSEKIRALDEFGQKIMALHDSQKVQVKS